MKAEIFQREQIGSPAIRRAGNRGFTLIELLVGMAILSVVSLMVMQLFGSSVRMHHKAITYADIQKESQLVSRRMAAAVMNAKSIYMEDVPAGVFLFTGERTEQTDTVSYSGNLFWYNRETGCLYQNSGASLEEPAGAALPGSEGETGKGRGGKTERAAGGTFPGALTVDAVRKAMEDNSSGGKEYLISDKVESLKLEIAPDLQPGDRVEAPGSCFYRVDGAVTLDLSLAFRHLDSDSYAVDTSATPRNQIELLWWKKSG